VCLLASCLREGAQVPPAGHTYAGARKSEGVRARPHLKDGALVSRGGHHVSLLPSRPTSDPRFVGHSRLARLFPPTSLLSHSPSFSSLPRLRSLPPLLLVLLFLSLALSSHLSLP